MHQRFSSLRRIFLILVFAFFVSLGVASAQSSNATLHGTVTDAGGVLPGVTVKLKAPATGLGRDVVTNATGTGTARQIQFMFRYNF